MLMSVPKEFFLLGEIAIQSPELSFSYITFCSQLYLASVRLQMVQLHCSVILKKFRLNLTYLEWESIHQYKTFCDTSLIILCKFPLETGKSHFKSEHLQLTVYPYTHKIKTLGLTVFVNKEH